MKNLLIKTFFIFLLFTVIFSLIQFSSQNLAGADSYYHIKHGYIYQMEGLSQNFPWLQNNFSNGYSDPYFLYHILLIPFTFGNLIFGAKLAAILFVSFIFTLFYWILKQYKIKSAFLLTILLFCASNVFIFRMALARPHLLSLLFLLAGFYLISKKKYFWLFILSIIYALSYEVSILIIFIAFIYFISEYIFKRKFDLKLLLCPASGILIGYFIHPNGLEYLYATYLVIFKIPFLEKSIFDLGIEISPITDFSAFASSNLIVLILFLGGFISCVINIANDIAPIRLRAIKNAVLDNDKKIILYSLFLISVFFFILTLKANRFVEYWVPFTVLFGAFGINSLQTFFLPIAKGEIKRGLINADKNPSLTLPFVMRENFQRRIFIKFFTGIILLGLTIANISYASFGIKSGMEYDKYKSAAEWLNENTPQGSIIFHTSWGDFPQLFFYNHRNYYIIGMDPTFMYTADPEKYWLWRHITEEGIICLTQKCKPPLNLPLRNGEKRDKLISEIIKKEFKAEYILISDIQEYEQFKKVLEKENGVKKVFSKNKMEIWKIK